MPVVPGVEVWHCRLFWLCSEALSRGNVQPSVVCPHMFWVRWLEHLLGIWTDGKVLSVSAGSSCPQACLGVTLCWLGSLCLDVTACRVKASATSRVCWLLCPALQSLLHLSVSCLTCYCLHPQDVDLEGEATPGRGAAKGAGEGEKGAAAASPATLESPERARPGGMRPPETPEQAAEGEPNLDTTTHSPILDPGTPERPN